MSPKREVGKCSDAYASFWRERKKSLDNLFTREQLLSDVSKYVKIGRVKKSWTKDRILDEIVSLEMERSCAKPKTKAEKEVQKMANDKERAKRSVELYASLSEILENELNHPGISQLKKSAIGSQLDEYKEEMEKARKIEKELGEKLMRLNR